MLGLDQLAVAAAAIEAACRADTLDTAGAVRAARLASSLLDSGDRVGTERSAWHEIRGKLAVIAGHADALLDEAPGHRSALGIIEATEQIAQLLGGGEEPSVPTDQPGSPASERRVLVIDDDALTRDHLERALHGLGAVVRSAAGGRDGLALAEELVPDLVLLDLGLPDMNGREVLRQLRARGVNVVVATGSAGPALERELGELGALALLTKPVPRLALASVLELTGASGVAEAAPA